MTAKDSAADSKKEMPPDGECKITNGKNALAAFEKSTMSVGESKLTEDGFTYSSQYGTVGAVTAEAWKRCDPDKLGGKKIVLISGGRRLRDDEALPSSAELQVVDEGFENYLRGLCFQECDKDQDGTLSFEEANILVKLLGVLADDDFYGMLCHQLQVEKGQIDSHSRKFTKEEVIQFLGKFGQPELENALQFDAEKKKGILCPEGHEFLRVCDDDTSRRACDPCKLTGVETNAKDTSHFWCCEACDYDECPRCFHKLHLASPPA